MHAGAHWLLGDSSCVGKSLHEEFGKSCISDRWGHMVIQAIGGPLLLKVVTYLI